jgi:hypothetical protein
LLRSGWHTRGCGWWSSRDILIRNRWPCLVLGPGTQSLWNFHVDQIGKSAQDKKITPKLTKKYNKQQKVKIGASLISTPIWHDQPTLYLPQVSPENFQGNQEHSLDPFRPVESKSDNLAEYKTWALLDTCPTLYQCATALPKDERVHSIIQVTCGTLSNVAGSQSSYQI